MSEVLANIWPIHGIAWVLCAVIGLICGWFLSNATEKRLTSGLILIAVALMLALGVGQAIHAAGLLQYARLNDGLDWLIFYSQAQDTAWIYSQYNDYAQTRLSTAIGAVVMLIFGLVALLTRWENET